MSQRGRLHIASSFACRLILFWLCAGSYGFGAEFEFESTGVRFGGKPTGSGHNFHEADTFVNWYLPWDWNLDPPWYLRTRLDFSMGWLGEPGENAAIGTLGPTFVCGPGRCPVSFEGGVSPTLLSRYEFTDKNFGIPFQFTSHLGVNYDIGGHFRISYRFQHMSNAGLGPHNPGLNLQVVGVSYRF
jgi:hypothetical protein